MQNFVDDGTAEVQRAIRRSRKNTTSKMVLKRKTGYPLPSLIVTRDGYMRPQKAMQDHVDAAAVSTGAKSLGGSVGSGAATGAALGSIVPGIGTAVGGVVGAVVGGLSSLLKKKPVGDKGWQSWVAATPRPQGAQYYPSITELLAPVYSGSRDGHDAGKDERDAMQKTYNQATGMGSQGDWKFAVTSTNPIIMDWFKGDSEHFTLTAKTNTVANTQPVTLGTAVQTQPTINNPGVSTTVGQLSGLPSPIGTGAQVQQDLSGIKSFLQSTGIIPPNTTQQIPANTMQTTQQMGTSVASIGKMNPLILVGFGAVVLVVIFFAFKHKD